MHVKPYPKKSYFCCVLRKKVSDTESTYETLVPHCSECSAYLEVGDGSFVLICAAICTGGWAY